MPQILKCQRVMTRKANRHQICFQLLTTNLNLRHSIATTKRSTKQAGLQCSDVQDQGGPRRTLRLDSGKLIERFLVRRSVFKTLFS